VVVVLAAPVVAVATPLAAALVVPLAAVVPAPADEPEVAPPAAVPAEVASVVDVELVLSPGLGSAGSPQPNSSVAANSGGKQAERNIE
jgi:hypothetical protein